jgi:DNA-binding transcriptional ArsR family regulator
MPSEDHEAQSATGASSASGHPVMPMRRVADAGTLRALSHPVRMLLLESLGMHGAMTATEVGERIGESPTTCSFHLRQLARYGFVEEAGGGKGRARPWRIVREGLHLTSEPGDPESEMAAEALGRLIQERQISRYQTWRSSRHSYPQEWRRAATNAEHLIYLTSDELSQLNQDFKEILDSRFADRYFSADARPPGSLPVEILITNYPIQPPSAYADFSDQPAQTSQEGEQR